MAYFTLVGSHGKNRLNKSGFGSRGYWVFRRGSTIIMRWGAIEVKREHLSYRVFWSASWRERRVELSTPAVAKEWMKDRVADLCDPAHGYSRLPRGLLIGRCR